MEKVWLMYDKSLEFNSVIENLESILKGLGYRLWIILRVIFFYNY